MSRIASSGPWARPGVNRAMPSKNAWEGNRGMEVVKWIFVVAALVGMALALVELATEEPDTATDSDRLPDGLAGTWERKTPDVNGWRRPSPTAPSRSSGCPETRGWSARLQRSPIRRITTHHGRHHIQHHPVGRFRAGTHGLLQGKETVMCNDIDFRKAVRLMEEARDRLDEASEILGVFDSGDMSGRNTIADKAWSIDQDIDGVKAIAERMGEEI